MEISKLEWQKEHFEDFAKFPTKKDDVKSDFEQAKGLKMDKLQAEYSAGISACKLQILEDKVANLEEMMKIVRSKVKTQAKEFQRFKEATNPQKTSDDNTHVLKEENPMKDEVVVEDAAIQESEATDKINITINGHKVDRVKLQSAKLQLDAPKCALHLMSCLFSAEEMVNGNPSGMTNSKDVNRRQTIQRLDPIRMKYIADFIQQKWPEASYSALLKRKTQKCTDMHNNRRDLRHTN